LSVKKKGTHRGEKFGNQEALSRKMLAFGGKFCFSIKEMTGHLTVSGNFCLLIFPGNKH
jgi:hypothetical protein